MERVFREAEEYHQYISPFRAISHNSLKHVVEKLDEGLKIRNIEEISYRVPETAIANTPEEDRFGLERHWKKGNMQLRYIEKIDVRINMSEKEVSIFTLPDLDGKVDMFGFASDDPLFHKWCADLFNYYWEKGKTKTVFEL